MRYLIILGFLLVSVSGSGQCDPLRYKTYIFDEVSVTSDIVYGSNTNIFEENEELLMDVYTPAGDEAQDRALVIIAHGGSFLLGDKSDEGVVEFAGKLARMGYVAASINYRLGLSTNMFLDPPDSLDAMAAVVRGMHDMKAAIRWFRKNVEIGGNQYGIDPEMVFIAGFSAGGFIVNQLAYLDQEDEMPEFTPDMPGLEGGIAGNSGNPGYGDEVIAGLNVAGALIDTAWIQPGDERLISTHGTADDVVPFGYDTLSINFPGIEIVLGPVYGSSVIHERLDNLGIPNCFTAYQGQGHVPESNDPAYFDTTFVKTRNFFSSIICNETENCEYEELVTGITAITTGPGSVSVYPNPFTSSITIESDKAEYKAGYYEIFGIDGVKITAGNIPPEGSLTLGFLPSGSYILSIRMENGAFVTRRIVKN